MVWIETPTNPTMKVVDIKLCSDLVHEHNKDIVVVVDNTFMSAYFQVRTTRFGLLLFNPIPVQTNNSRVCSIVPF